MGSGFPDNGCSMDGMRASYAWLLNLPFVEPVTNELDCGTSWGLNAKKWREISREISREIRRGDLNLGCRSF